MKERLELEQSILKRLKAEEKRIKKEMELLTRQHKNTKAAIEVTNKIIKEIKEEMK